MSTEAGETRTLAATRFKAESLAILDEVEQMKISVTVTKHGRPIARVVPLDADTHTREMKRTVRLVAEADEAYYTTGKHWDAEPS